VRVLRLAAGAGGRVTPPRIRRPPRRRQPLGAAGRPADAGDPIAGAAARAGELAVPGMPSAPRRRLAVLTCMDARIDPLALLGLQRGDAHVIRNAGGLATDDAVRSLAASQRMLGTEQVIVVMHDGCGLLGGSDEEFAAALAADGAHPGWRLGAFGDVEEAVRAGVARLRASAELPHRDDIRGFVFDPETGRLREV
jgi:carbonic anhydrase